jgi:hypothetical protein
MAEYLYLIQCNQYTKIGITNDIDYRLRTLQTGNPYPLTVIDKFEFDEPGLVEYLLHKKYAYACVRGEWFCLSESEVDEVIDICRTFDERVMRMDGIGMLMSALAVCMGSGLKVDWHMKDGGLHISIEGLRYDPEAGRIAVVEK